MHLLMRSGRCFLFIEKTMTLPSLLCPFEDTAATNLWPRPLPPPLARRRSIGWPHDGRGRTLTFHPGGLFYMRYTINDNNRGFLFRHGRYVKMLEPGVHITWLDSVIEVVPVNEAIKSKFTSIDLLLKDAKVASQTVLIEVPDQKISLHFVNGLFVEALRPGRYLFWTIFDRHEFREVDISTPEVDPSIPLHIFAKLPATMYSKSSFLAI
jgi:hypothetical protein